MSLTVRPHLHHFNPRNGKPTSRTKDWTQIYTIYQWQTLLILLFHTVFFFVLSFTFLFYFEPICSFLETFFLFGNDPDGAPRFVARFTSCIIALSGVCLFFVIGNFFYSSLVLHHDMTQRMVGYVSDWSTLKLALDVGCGRGILLNSIATKQVALVGLSIWTCQNGQPCQLSVQPTWKSKLRKVEQSHWLGRRPVVRGVFMNPVDHPHRGDEGKSFGRGSEKTEF